MKINTSADGRRRRPRRALLLALVALAAVAVPAAVWASHDFGDVPTSHQFHDQISAIKGAGITTGCGGGNYCPDDLVRRDAMAAFMHRGYGRAAESSFNAPGQYTLPLTGAIPAGPGDHTVEVLIQGPAGATASGYVTATYLPFGPTGTNTGIARAERGAAQPRPRR